LIVPIRGEYLALKERKKALIQRLVYPIPEPGVPFLGVHFTPTMSGDVLVGPNAVPALARDGYSWSSWSTQDLWDMATFSGFWRLGLRHARFALQQVQHSISLSHQLSEVQRYFPSIEATDLARTRSGVRAQAVDTRGELVDDFVFDCTRRVLHTRNAPSPGATSSMVLAETIVDRLVRQL